MTCQNRKWRCDIDYDKLHVLSTSENETTMCVYSGKKNTKENNANE